MNVIGLVKGLVEFAGYEDCEVVEVYNDDSQFDLIARKDLGNGMVSVVLTAVVTGDEEFFDISLLKLIDGSIGQYEDVKTIRIETI